jgi:trehalose 6-phosphate phosphatase
MRLEPLAALEPLILAHRAGRGLAILLDYDGTLVPIAQHPRLAVLDPETRALLANLAQAPRVLLGFVSGRPIDEVRHLLGLRDALYAGTNGLEREWMGMRLLPGESRSSRALIEDVALELAAVAAMHCGAWIERKPAGMTFHYRQAAPQQLVHIRQAALTRLAPFRPQIYITEGPHAIEVTRDVGWTKGRVVHWVCTQLASGFLPIFAGDAQNDTEAIAAALELNGAGIGVGPLAPRCAQCVVDDSAALISVLRRLLGALLGGGAPGEVG